MPGLAPRCRWEAHLRTKESLDTSPAHTCMPCQVGHHSLQLPEGGSRAWALAWPLFSGLCPAEDSAIRCEQLDLLQDWLADFRKSTSSSSTANPEELVAFDVICGDLNFDNCSSGEAVLLPSDWVLRGAWAPVGLGSSKNFLLLRSACVGSLARLEVSAAQKPSSRRTHTLPGKLSGPLLEAVMP